METLQMLEKDRHVLCWFNNSPPITSGKKGHKLYPKSKIDKIMYTQYLTKYSITPLMAFNCFKKM